MSKIVRKTSLVNHGSRTYHYAEIYAYPDMVKLVIRNEDQYPIMGADCTSEEDAKLALRLATGEGWKVTGVTEYKWIDTGDGRTRLVPEYHNC